MREFKKAVNMYQLNVSKHASWSFIRNRHNALIIMCLVARCAAVTAVTCAHILDTLTEVEQFIGYWNLSEFVSDYHFKKDEEQGLQELH